MFRHDSRKLPIGDPDVDWEETIYLNLIVHQLEYTITLAICSRTSPKDLQVKRQFRWGSNRSNKYGTSHSFLPLLLTKLEIR